MSLFERKYRKHFFLELFKITDQQSVLECDSLGLILSGVNFIEKATGLRADDFSLNYSSKSYKTLNGFKSAYRKSSNLVYCHVDFNSNMTNTFFTFSNPILNHSKNSKGPANSTLHISFQVSDEFITTAGMNRIAEEVIMTYHFEYGYIHDYLSSKFLGETPIRRSLFASSIEVSEADHLWTNHQIGIGHGYLKKLYSVNYLNKSQLCNPLLREVIKRQGQKKAISNDVERWTLNDDELKAIVESKECEQVCIVTKDFSFLKNPLAKRLKEKMSVLK